MKKMRRTKFIALLLVLMLAVGMLAACGGSKKDEPAEEPAEEAAEEQAEEAAEEQAEEATEETAEEPTEEAAEEPAEEATASTKPTTDREGNAVTIPEEVNRIVSLAPSTTEVLEDLGLLDKIVGVDTYTPVYVQGLESLPQFDMMQPDIEAIAELKPDIVFTSGMSYIEGDPYSALVNMGVCVVVIPSSSSIEAIKEDILFTAECVSEDAKAKGQKLVEDMQAQIDEIAAIGSTITEKKTVMFEVSALPSIYSFGKGTFLDEMITIVGAENVFGDQEGWVGVTEEDAVKANPDVILSSADYMGDPVAEILGRTGWENVSAVKNSEVYYIDNGSSSHPNHRIIKALQEMAEYIYPDAYDIELENAA